MGKKNKGGDCPMVPGWLVTYGDLMSLLLTFFILLQSFSSVQESDFKKAIGSIMIALGTQPLGETMIVTPMLGKKGLGKTAAEGNQALESEEIIDDIQQELKAEVNDSLDQSAEDISKSVNMGITKKGVLITINDSISFKTGSTELSDRFKKVLTAIGKVVAPKMDHYEMIVEGHTDNVPIASAKYPSNWELSTSRAIAALRFMLNSENLPQNRVTAVGYGEFRPKASNNNQAGRLKNRRVEIYLNNVPPQYQIYGGDKTAPADSNAKAVIKN